MNVSKKFLALIAVIGSAALVHAQEGVSNVNQLTETASPDLPARLAPMGLPRLRGEVKPGEASSLAPGVFTVDALDAGAEGKSANGRRAITQGSARIVEIDAGQDWARPLQASASGVLFVSFSLYGSSRSEVTVGGARLGVIESPVDGNMQLMVGEPGAKGVQWHPVGLHFPLDVFGGKSLASLPVLTVRLDPQAGVWDLYFGSRQLADGLLLNPDAVDGIKGGGDFAVHAGNEGAWLCGLVQSAENPLFEDANGNGIDDAFEREKKGGLLARGVSSTERGDTAKEWRDSQRTHPPAAWLADRPRPDRLLTPAGGKGPTPKS